MQIFFGEPINQNLILVEFRLQLLNDSRTLLISKVYHKIISHLLRLHVRDRCDLYHDRSPLAGAALSAVRR